MDKQAKTFSDLKVGDEVIYVDESSETVEKVKKVNKVTLSVGGILFKKSNGIQYYQNCSWYSFIRIPYEGEAEKINHRNLIECHRSKLMSYIKNSNDESIEKIYNIVFNSNDNNKQ